MKKVLALTAGVLVALVPSGAAFAGEPVPVPGKAYGNCAHSSSGGNHHTALRSDVGQGKGNGGLVELGKTSRCVAPAEQTPEVKAPADDPTEPTAPAEPIVWYDPGQR